MILNNDIYLLNTISWAEREHKNKYFKIQDNTKFMKWAKALINKAYVIPGARIFIYELNPDLATSEIRCPEKIAKEFGVKERGKKEWRQVLTDQVSTLTPEDKKVLTDSSRSAVI